MLGLNRPRIPRPGAAAIWRLLESLPTPRRNLIIENLRLQQIYDVVYAAALDSALAEDADRPRSGIWFAQRVLREEDLSSGRHGAERLPDPAPAARPTYVKIGQMIASRGDVLPADIDRPSSRSSRATRRRSRGRTRATVIKASSARSPSTCSRRSSPSPSRPPRPPRSTGRRSTTAPLVAVKVQRPQIVAKTKADLGVITELASIAERRARASPGRSACGRWSTSSPGGVLQGARLHATRRTTRSGSRTTWRASRRSPCPRVYDELSGTRVLTMEFIAGSRSRTRPRCARPASTRRALGRLLHPGRHQADPHRRVLPWRSAPGQPHGRPPDQRLVFLDLGLVGQLKATQRVDLLGLIYALKATDIAGIPRRAHRPGQAHARRSTRRSSAPTSTGSPGSTWSTAA